ncbi:MAG TPA: biopolymer transporter ExbD [bacterium]|nr:biopolymer transporter ExbD [bacterium]
MQIRQRPAKRVRIEIIPMIDVIFFLLVFFMVSSLAMTRINSVKVLLPKMSGKAENMKQNIILTVKKDGTLLVNKTQVNLGTLGAQLTYQMQANPQEVVIVNADQAAGYGLVVQAMDKAKEVGVRKFALVAEAGEEK